MSTVSPLANVVAVISTTANNFAPETEPPVTQFVKSALPDVA